MKRIFITHIIIILTGLRIYAQLDPMHNQYQMNGLAINPAFAGSEDALSITLLHRNQWIGFEGAPVTSTLAVHSPLERENVALGFLLLYDQIGISRTTFFSGSYAYRITVPQGIFSLGLSAGLRLQNEALTELRKIDLDDEFIPSASRTFLLPDFNIGFYYKSMNYYAGLSMVSILGSKINTSNGRYKITLNLKETNYMMTGGFFGTVSEGIKLNPGTLIKYNFVYAFQVDLYLNAIFKEKFWFGTGYRSGNGMIWLIQFMANDQTRIAYAYGMDFSTLGNYHKGSHEIMLKYVFNYLIEAVNPRQF